MEDGRPHHTKLQHVRHAQKNLLMKRLPEYNHHTKKIEIQHLKLNETGSFNG